MANTTSSHTERAAAELSRQIREGTLSDATELHSRVGEVVSDVDPPRAASVLVGTLTRVLLV